MDARRSHKPTIQLHDSFFDSKARDFSPIAALSEPSSRRSFHSSSSDYATPASPTFSAGGHLRVSSSSTTLSSSPTIPEAVEPLPVVKKSAPALPDVAEDPLERDGYPPDTRAATFSFDIASRWSHDVPAQRAELTSYYFDSYVGRDSDFFSDSEAPPEPLSKRRRSGDSPMRNLTDRVLTRFPSLSRRRMHKRSSTVATSEPCSGVTSPTGARSRSNSRARSIFRRSAAAAANPAEDDFVDVSQPPNGIGTIAEDESDEYTSSSHYRDTDAESISGRSEHVQRVSTPLLPHLMGEPRNSDGDDSTLQPPTVAPANELAALSLSPAALNPQMNGLHSPSLSSQPSLNGMHHSYLSGYTNSSTEAPAVQSVDAKMSDEYSQLLGHADFDIEPSPYLPQSCSREACQQLLSDWEQARKEFAKHLCHTSIHYGDASKTYRLTQEKWEWLDSVWRQKSMQARAAAMRNGESVANIPLEPAPVLQVPSMDEKFPVIGDQGIVGPMEQVPPAAQTTLSRRPSKKQQFMKRIGSIRMRSRSSSAA